MTVEGAESILNQDLNVYAFDGITYTGYHGVTDSSGQISFTLPFGAYRFRVDFNGTQFWSDSENHCDVNNGCQSVSIAVTKPVTVNVKDSLGVAYPDLAVYAFDGENYTGYHGVTDESGQVTLTLPQGQYHFRADYKGVQFWDNADNDPLEGNTCTIPGCENIELTIPGGAETTDVTINYAYDPIYRLTGADYSNGDAFEYTYDAVGNRLTQNSQISGLDSSFGYTYDVANRLATVDGVAYVYDANGNLLDDGLNTYAYDPANRLTSLNGPSATTTYTYNGLGDRLSQNGVIYTLDLNAGLTQVLSDGTASYTYGINRISQQKGNTTEYFLGDALGSVRQLTSQNAQVTLAKSYDPFGVTTQTLGPSHSDFAYTGEATDSNGMVYLRARYYNPSDGRFLSRDTWEGNSNSPQSLNRWNYAQSNPITYTDPTGNCIFAGVDTVVCLALAGATAGFVTGAVGGAIFGLATYYDALSGKCGCEMQEQAVAAGSLGYYTGVIALTGAIFGGVAGAIAAAAPIGLFIVGAAGIVISGYDAYKTYNIIVHETGLTKCTLLRGLFDLAGILGGVSAIRTSVQAFRASGSILKWSETPVVEPEPVPGETCSFSGETNVATKNGETPISEIQIGDYVLGWNEETGEISWYPVTAKLQHDDPTIVHLTIDGEEIATTPEHPFYTEEHGWVAAGDLVVNIHIRKADGSYGELESTHTEESNQRMYNLTVEEAHTFFVGAGQWLVHNTCQVLGGGTPSPKGSRLATLARAIFKEQLKLWWQRQNTTVALTEVDGQLIGTVNGGADVDGAINIQGAIESLGGRFIPNTNGPNSHAEVFLYESVSGVKTIGISNTTGPCPACSGYFTPLIGQVELVFPLPLR